MFDTYVTIVGNVLTAPTWRRTSRTNSLVANFKVASTARRLDRENNRWIDGNSLRVRVNCWRKLAEGVASSVMVGDPIVVVGRLYTRDWTDDEGNHRTLYEMEAVAVGHDLSRGRGTFARNRPTLATSSVEDAEAEVRVHGEPTEAVPPEDAPVRPGETFTDGDAALSGVAVPPMSGDDELTALRGGGFDAAPMVQPGDDELSPPEGADEPDLPDDADGTPDDSSLGVPAGSADDPADDPRPVGGRSRRARARETVDA